MLWADRPTMRRDGVSVMLTRRPQKVTRRYLVKWVAVWCKGERKEQEANESMQVDKQSGARRSGLVVQIDGGVVTMGKVRVLA
jgi:hypothetical protein